MTTLSLKTAALLSSCLLFGCTSTEDKINNLLQRHLDAFVFVEGGSFMMGNPGGWSYGKDSLPAHKVTLDSFSIQKYEVTQGDMDLFMEVTGYVSTYKYYDVRRAEAPKRFVSELPAAVTWDDARAFCHWVGGLTEQVMDLPTEAQWEYAARSRGGMYRFATDTGQAEAGVNMAVKAELGIHDLKALPLPSGSFPSNPLGLYDMSGNVIEWVIDNYQPDYYQHSSEHNPTGPLKAEKLDFFGVIREYKVARGGRFKDFLGNTTVSRFDISSSSMASETGFRCAKIE